MPARLRFAASLVALALGLGSAHSRESRPGPEPAAAPDAGMLFPFWRDGQWGLIDVEGRIVLKPMFDQAPRFSGGHAVVTVAKRPVWLSRAGKIIRPQTPAAALRGFSEGLAPVNIGRQIHMGDILKAPGKWGFMDETGQVVIEPTFPQVGGFSGGLAPAASAEGGRRPLWGYLDRTGKWAIRPRFNQAGGFFEDRAFVGVSLPGERFVKQGCIDRQGKMVIAPEFEQAKGFSEGRAAVRKNGKWGYVDHQGKKVTALEYEAAEPFRDGLGLVWRWEKDSRGRLVKTRCGYVNRAGKLVDGLKYEAGYSCADGMGAVQAAGKWGYVDHTGKLQITPRFTSAGPFAEGLAAVQSGGKYGYTDKAGKMLIAPQYLYAEPFAHSLARVTLGKQFDGERLLHTKYAYISREGKTVFTYQLQPRQAPSW